MDESVEDSEIEIQKQKEENMGFYLSVFKDDRQSRVSENCQEDCLYNDKFLSIYPLSKGISKKAGEKNPLQKFNYKNLYLYDDHIAIFNVQEQKENKEGAEEEVGDEDYLDSLPYQIFLKPCSDFSSVCTLRETEEMYREMDKEVDFIIDDKVEEIMKENKTDCLVIQVSMLQKSDQLTLMCSHSYLSIMELKYMLNQFLGRFSMIRHYKVIVLNDQRDDIFQAYLHIHETTLSLDNNPKLISESQQAKTPTHINYFQLDILQDLHQLMLESFPDQLSFIWKNTQQPSIQYQRCIKLLLRSQQDDDEEEEEEEEEEEKEEEEEEKEQEEQEKEDEKDDQATEGNQNDKVQHKDKHKDKHALHQQKKFVKRNQKTKVICFVNDNSNKEYTIEQAQLLKKELEIVLKMQFYRTRKEQADKILESEQEPELNCNSNEIIFLNYLLFNNYLSFVPVSNYFVDNNYTDFENIKSVQKVAIAGQIGKLCHKKENCMLLLAHMIKIGKIDFSKNMSIANSYFNPYKERAEKHIEEFSGGSSKSKKIDENIYELECQDLSVSDSIDKRKVMKAHNTFKNVLQGRTLEDLQFIDLKCNYLDNDDEDEFVMFRGVNLLQFISLYDPWIVYLGTIQQKIA